MDKTNCKNCGAPLHYEQLSGKAVCAYCRTEYRVNKQGFVTDNIIQLELFDKKMEFFIESIKVEPHYYEESTRLFDGSLSRAQSRDDITLELKKL